MAEKKTTVVLGASMKPERFSNKAVRALVQHGHRVIPVHPLHRTIEGIPAIAELESVTEPIDTVTVYLSPETGAKLAGVIVRVRPKRVIMNPGAESDELERTLEAAGIKVERACTLVMLSAGTF